jgi:hypothetical protein
MAVLPQPLQFVLGDCRRRDVFTIFFCGNGARRVSSRVCQLGEALLVRAGCSWSLPPSDLWHLCVHVSEREDMSVYSPTLAVRARVPFRFSGWLNLPHASAGNCRAWWTRGGRVTDVPCRRALGGSCRSARVASGFICCSAHVTGSSLGRGGVARSSSLAGHRAVSFMLPTVAAWPSVTAFLSIVCCGMLGLCFASAGIRSAAACLDAGHEVAQFFALMGTPAASQACLH